MKDDHEKTREELIVEVIALRATNAASQTVTEQLAAAAAKRVNDELGFKTPLLSGDIKGSNTIVIVVLLSLCVGVLYFNWRDHGTMTATFNELRTEQRIGNYLSSLPPTSRPRLVPPEELQGRLDKRENIQIRPGGAEESVPQK